MRTFSARGLGVFCGVVMGIGVTAADAATLSLRAVKLNGNNVAATNNITVAPNDLIEVDAFIDGWAAQIPGPNDGVRAYQFRLLGRVGYPSGENGIVIPEGWEAPVEQQPCTSNDDCLNDERYPVCGEVGTGCRSETHNPALGVNIDFARSSYIFSGFDGINGIDTSQLDYRFFGLANAEFTVDTGVPRYAGTIRLKVSNNACGVFTIGTDLKTSFIANRDATNTVNLISTPLTVTVSNCVLQLLDCDPDHCTIDARQPIDRVTGARQTLDRFTAHFSGSSAGLAAAGFRITQTFNGGNPGPLPGFSSFTNTGNQSLIVLNRRINANALTCIRHNLSNKQCCFGVLPGDADGNNISQPGDVFELLDNLNGQVNPRLPNERCDLDRSNLCTAADLLLEMDLLNGAEQFVPFNNSTLPACPNMIIR